MGFSASLMGLSGHKIHLWERLREKATINDNGIRTFDIALLGISSFGFAFSLVALVLACCQFPKRRGERTGKGTYGNVLTGLILLLLSEAYAGIAAAYTAFSAMKMMTSQSAVTPYSTTQQLAALGPWAEIDTLAQANAFLRETNYLDYRVYRATVAVCWTTLATVFFAMVVHFALPHVLKYLGMTRPPREEKEEVKRSKMAHTARMMGERRSHHGYQAY